MPDVTTPDAPSEGQGRTEPVDIQRRDAAQLPRLRDVGHRGPGAAGCPGRPEARPHPHPVRDVRRRVPARPRLLQVRPRHRRGDGQLPPARRLGHLRHPGPDGAAVGHADAADRRPGQLRLAGQRPGRGHAVHRVPADPAGHGDAAGHRQGDCRFPAELRRPVRRAGRAAGPVPEPARQRLRGHRGGDGHQDPAAQPARGRRRACSGTCRTSRPPTRNCSTRCSSGSRARTSRRPRRSSGAAASRRPTAPAAARSPCAPWSRSRKTARGRTCLVATELPFQVNPDNLAKKIAELASEGRISGIANVRDESSARVGPAAGYRAQARRRGQGRAEQPVQAHAAAGHLRRQHGRAGRRRAAHAAPGPDDPVLGQPPDRGHHPAHAVPAAQGAGAGAHPERAAEGDRPDRRGDRAHPGQRVGVRGAAGPDGPARHRRDPGPRHPRHAAAQAGRARAPGS